MENCMNQEIFIRDFQEALAGKVPERVIHENTEYYRNYIRTQISQGMTEVEVLQSLGDPRLLAKTVVESQKFLSEGQSSYSEYQRSTEQRNVYSEERKELKVRQVPGWLIAVIIILIILAILRFAFSILKFFAPLIIMGAVIFFSIRVLKNIFGD